MVVIRPTCRSRFTSTDFDYISSVLGTDPAQREGLARLFHDQESLNLILDQQRLFHALLEDRGLLGISTCFYFYVLVRHTLLRAEVDDRNLADYVAALLAEFASTRRMRGLSEEGEGATDYLVDLLRAMDEADESTRFLLTLHLGNYALFLSGLFSEYIEYRARRRAAPGLSYYEELGSGHFRAARSHRLAARYDLAPVLVSLAEKFGPTRRALNDLSDRLLIWGEAGLP